MLGNLLIIVSGVMNSVWISGDAEVTLSVPNEVGTRLNAREDVKILCQ